MIQSLLNLPYVYYWLPAAAALVIGGPVYWLAMWPGRRRAVSDAEAPAPSAKGQVDPFTSGSTQEQRKSFRRRGNPIEVLFTPEDEPQQPERGYVLDRSVGGLRVMMAREVPPGTLLSVRPVNVSPMIPWVQIEVRNCVPSGTQAGEYDVGCQFIKAPPYPVLLLFG